MKTPSEKTLKNTIKKLISAGTTFDIVALESIYHQDLQVIMINDLGEKMISNKETFKNLFKSKRDNGDAPLNTWAKFHHIEVNNHQGHIILSRKVNLTGTEQKIVLSIDLVYEENRWQVIREVIFN